MEGQAVSTFTTTDLNTFAARLANADPRWGEPVEPARAAPWFGEVMARLLLLRGDESLEYVTGTIDMYDMNAGDVVFLTPTRIVTAHFELTGHDHMVMSSFESSMRSRTDIVNVQITNMGDLPVDLVPTDDQPKSVELTLDGGDTLRLPMPNPPKAKHDRLGPIFDSLLADTAKPTSLKALHSVI